MVYYKTIDHTADIGIQVFGTDMKQLFIHAGKALFDLIAHADKGENIKNFLVSADGIDWPDLMVAWLRELLYLWAGKRLLVRSIGIETLTPFGVCARVGCTRFVAGCHEIRHDIKAVTYHHIDVRQTAEGFESTIIFDV